MPLGYGGGIRSLEQAKEIFRIGFEKVILNSLIFDNLKEVSRIAEFAGSQSVVASIDYKRDIFGHLSVYTHDGADRTSIKLKESVRMAVEAGVGEILLTSMDYEGRMNGYDLDAIKLIGNMQIPVIVNGGAGSISDIKRALNAGADAVAVSSFFVYYGANKAILINTPSEQEYYAEGIFED